MDDFSSLNAEARATDVPFSAQPSVRRRPTAAQRRRESLIDRRIELGAAIGGLVLAGTCAGAGAWSAIAAWGIPQYTVVVMVGAIAAVGGSLLAMHFAVTIARIAGFIGHTPEDPATAVPTEIWLIALAVGGVGGGATGVDVGTLVLIVGGRTLWDLPPATTMVAVVVLPLVGIFPLAIATFAAARRIWLRRPVLVAGATWVAGTVVGTFASGVWSHLPDV